MKYNDDGGKNDKSMMVMTMEIYSGACCCSSGAAQQPTDPAPAPTGGEGWVYTGNTGGRRGSLHTVYTGRQERVCIGATQVGGGVLLATLRARAARIGYGTCV